MNYKKTDKDVQEYINKEAELMCKFKMEQFFTSIRNIIGIRDHTFSTDPYFYRDTNDLKEAHKLIYERYRKEVLMNKPTDSGSMVHDSRRKFMDKAEKKFREQFLTKFQGRDYNERMFADRLERFVFFTIEKAFDVDENYNFEE